MTSRFSRMRYYFLVLLAILLFSGCPPEEPTGPATPPTEADPPTFLSGTIDTIDYAIYGNGQRGIYTAFSRRIAGSLLELSPLLSGRPSEVLQDQTGTVYDIFGRGTGGANGGETLEPVRAGTNFWIVSGGLFPGHSLGGEVGSVPDSLELRSDPRYEVPTNSLFAGAGFGIIVPLDAPEFVSFTRRDEQRYPFLEDDDFLVGICLNGDIRLYSGVALAAFEIINDEVGGVAVAVTYSPLSGSVRVWQRPAGTDARLGVTGMLINSAMLMFDRTDEGSQYHQITGRCVTGNCRGKYLQPVNYLRATWREWRELVFEGQLMVPPATIDLDRARRMDARQQITSPHRFPVDFIDGRLPQKEMVFTLTDGVQGISFPLDALR